MDALTESAVQDALKNLPDWKFDGSAIVRTTTFPSFMRATDFVCAVAEIAEAADHHPDIEIRYHRVTVRYWTHRAKGVTALDFDGAASVEARISDFKNAP